MKRKFSYSLLAAFAAAGFAAAEPVYTTPVGYVSQEIKGNSFNLIGLTLHQPSVTAGSISSIDSTSISVASLNFEDILIEGDTYIFELTSGTAEGIIQVVSDWSGSILTTPDDISTYASVGDSFIIRPADTIASVFGLNNESGLLEGSVTTADRIWVPNSDGGFDQYFRQAASPPFVPDAIWAKVGTSGSFGNTPLIYTDSIFIQRRSADDLDLVVAGEVKMTGTYFSIMGESFNYISSVAPAGATLQNSTLQDSLQSGTVTTADRVWMPNTSGGFDQFYYQPASPPFVPDPQWVKIGVSGDAGGQPLTPGIIIQRRGVEINAFIDFSINVGQ